MKALVELHRGSVTASSPGKGKGSRFRVDLPLQTHEFDVAFVDIGLPGIDGYELVRKARANGRVPRMIAMSGYGQERDRERALAAGFDLHLTKPVSVGEMLRATRRDR